MKKLLSIVLALSLCLTAMMGCFVVSAETNAITAGDVEIVAGNDAVVTFTLATEGISAAMVEIAYTDLDLKAIGYANAVGTEQLTVEFAHSAEVYDSEGNVTEDFTTANANDTIKAILNVGDIVNDKINTIDIVLTFNAPATGEYVVNVTKIEAATAGTYDATAGWTDEEALITINADDAAANVVVIAPCDHTEVTYTDNGDGTHTSACANEACTGGFVPATEPHNYVDGECVCGAEEEVEHVCSGEWVYDSENRNYTRTCECGITETKELEYSEETVQTSFVNTLGLEDAIVLNYYIPATMVEGYDGFFMVVNQSLANGTTRTETLDGTYSAQYKEYLFVYEGIAAAQLGDKIIGVVYYVKDGVAYPSNEREYNPVSYALDHLSRTPGNAKLKTTLVDLLNYGAEAQKVFKYNQTNLVNAVLTEDQLALGTTADPAMESITDLGTDNDSKTVKNTLPALALESRVGINYYTDLTGYKGDKANLTLVISYAGKEATATFDEFTASGNEYYYGFYGLSAPQMRNACTFKMYENYGTASQVQVNATMTYSIESYAADRSSTSKYLPVSIAMLKYGDSASIYFS